MRRGWRRSCLAMLLAMGPAVALAAATPAWVSAFPHDPDAYVGVGYADKRRYPVRYREAAQAAALAQISREISVSLRSQEALSRREDARGWEETWSQSLRAESRNELSGYRLVDVHETGEGFWALYALDKAVHHRRTETRLALQAAALESLLAARDLPAAWRRLATLDPAGGPASAGRAAVEALGERIGDHALRSVLVPGSEPWIWDPGTASSRVRVRLRDGAEGGLWCGSTRLRIRNQGDTSGGCAVETDGEGGFDLAPLYLDCGLDPGRWRVTWMEPGPGGPAATVEAGIRTREWTLAVSADQAGMVPWREPVSAEIAALASPYFRIRGEDEAGAGGLPRVEVRLLSVEADSLDGLHFAALRGTVRLTGGGAHAVTGKGGHADRSKARERALRDFAAEVGKRIAPPRKEVHPRPG